MRDLVTSVEIMQKLTDDEKVVLKSALDLRKGELDKMQKKSEKLGLIKQAEDFKRLYIAVDVLRAKIATDDE